VNYHQYWEKIIKKNHEITSLYSTYWHHYSNFNTWQFWVVLALLIVPLIILFFTVDRTRIFEILFYGYTVHMLWTYSVIFLERRNYLIHNFFITPLLPIAVNVTASVLPIGYLLLYQYCTNKKKNFYLYGVVLSGFFAFGFGSIEKMLGLATLRKGLTLFHLFLFDITIIIIAYWLTKAILYFRAKSKGKVLNSQE
jgi:hypothetical protein